MTCPHCNSCVTYLITPDLFTNEKLILDFRSVLQNPSHGLTHTYRLNREEAGEGNVLHTQTNMSAQVTHMYSCEFIQQVVRRFLLSLLTPLGIYLNKRNNFNKVI